VDDSERELGRLAGVMGSISEHLERIENKLDEHVSSEEKRLQHIEQQLSLSRFLLLTGKAIILTVVFILTLKIGDISSLWKYLK